MSFVRAAVSAPLRVTASTARREFSALLTPVEEFPGVPATTPTASSASATSVTTLSNGLTVVSENASSTSTVSLTFPNAGSSSEAASESGSALANKYMSFKSGSGLSAANILRNLENDGATPFASVSRFSATVGYTAAKDKAARLVPLLATTSTFEKWDVRDAQKSAQVAAEEANASAQTVLTESVYSAAYGAQSSTGATLYSTSTTVPSIKAFRERAYVLNGAVLAATGVDDHDAFVKSVEDGFSESAVGNASGASSPAYMGGEVRIHAPSTSYTHMALAFQGPASSPLANVVKQCITLGSESIVGFTDSAGLVGAYAGVSPAGAAAVADEICAVITSVPSADFVERAKSLAKAEAIFALEDGSQSLAEAMTSSVMEHGAFSAGSVGAAYDAITAQDVVGALEGMAKSNPSFSAVGDLSSTPYQGSIAAKLG